MRKNILTFLMALVLALGCTATSFAAENTGGAVGYVNMQKVYQSYPDIQMTMSALDLEQQKAEKEFNDQSTKLDDKGKQDLYNKLMQQLNKREQELTSPIDNKIRKAIDNAAKAKGINSVVDASVMLSGGVDLTDDVIAAISQDK